MEAEYVLFRLQIEEALMREHILFIVQIQNIQQDYLIWGNILHEAAAIRLHVHRHEQARNRVQEELDMTRCVLIEAAAIRQQLVRRPHEHAWNTEGDELIRRSVSIEAFRMREELREERNRLQEASMTRSVIIEATGIRQQLLRRQNEHAWNTEGEELIRRNVSNEAAAIRRHFLTTQHARREVRPPAKSSAKSTRI